MKFQSYIICATPRSGSTLLCDLLAGSGVAGKPNSYYRRNSISDFVAQLNIPADDPNFDQTYLAAILREGTQDTNLFGLRLMWGSLSELSACLDKIHPNLPNDMARLARAFGHPLYIHLSRQDIVSQAISRFKAEESGLWHLTADGGERERTGPPKTPIYDFAKIEIQRNEIITHNQNWTDWFAQHEIAPLHINYETLAADPHATLARILRTLDRDPTVAETVAPKSAKLATDESRDWATRFRDEHAQLGG